MHCCRHEILARASPTSQYHQCTICLLVASAGMTAPCAANRSQRISQHGAPSEWTYIRCVTREIQTAERCQTPQKEQVHHT
ncbi:hypothetical protein BU24DRAFT_230038 [Aaosphaeria arxii CBS 175.79]|uniref:Uncharacterized protein n=1 Tax=Aaosphaeria arxii CBS 175.79 TaxID=1450172 RepID=A0A6A5XJG7_9PLEO|nr:uncharacterized protein BU24DRAFT_230038 [Aaosphaeria arxii CBS 175.79]KAF2013103.1 hypothetical protein BU24DRAFT_230038 [Aaosphaeria arxii CBS 175.79]